MSPRQAYRLLVTLLLVLRGINNYLRNMIPWENPRISVRLKSEAEVPFFPPAPQRPRQCIRRIREEATCCLHCPFPNQHSTMQKGLLWASGSSIGKRESRRHSQHPPPSIVGHFVGATNMTSYHRDCNGIWGSQPLGIWLGWRRGRTCNN